MNDVRMAPINKYNEQWAADALLESFSFDDLIRSMNYYFAVSGNPTWKGFANSVDRIIKAMIEKEMDDKLRAERRRMAKEWLDES